MKVCAKCGFENGDGAKNCVNCLTDLQWAKVNLGKFHGSKEDTRRIGIESRKERGYSVPEDEFAPLEPIQIEKKDVVNKWGDLAIGFFGWVVFHNLYCLIGMGIIASYVGLILPYLIGLVVVIFIKRMWIGVGSVVAIFISAFVWISFGAPELAFLLPFPIGVFFISQ